LYVAQITSMDNPSQEVEFLIEVRTIGKMWTSEYPYGREERIVINTKESAYIW
jgi:hypothetical protein